MNYEDVFDYLKPKVYNAGLINLSDKELQVVSEIVVTLLGDYDKGTIEYERVLRQIAEWKIPCSRDTGRCQGCWDTREEARSALKRAVDLRKGE